MADPFIGQILLVGFNFAPVNWAICDGSLLPISRYTALFSLIGTYYGGNGTSNFALPDLRSRVPIGMGQGNGLSPYAIGEMTGVENVALAVTEMPAHNHLINADNAPKTAVQPPANNYLAAATYEGRAAQDYSASLTSPTTLNLNAVTLSGTGRPHTNIQPVLAMNYIIALNGIFPSRS
ncbi:phage tail protein [Methylocystis bryophila]|uniref:Phage tail protein n=1 Tax=Methylocystis bryophila TaxID=655015 RepID=A0A1W6MRY9_9HYPH|nr:tail fiber protein [Methylocystis bryophila]ARN80249.1 phage tail protein [Methylocystis bryophila]BDV40208.1 microcystin dependent MdpB family protein [Methylocystis bryophila]